MLRKHKYFSITEAKCDSLGRDVDPVLDAPEFVAKMLSLQYYAKTYNNMDMTHEITVGFRAILELGPLLTEVYHDVFADCGLCRNLFLSGLQCPKCRVLLPRSCVKKYLKQFKKCLLCKLPWQNEGSLSIRTQSLENGADASQAAQLTLTQDNTGEAKKFRLEENEDEVHAPILEPMVSPQRAGTWASPSMKRCEANSNAYCLATPVARPRTRYALSSDSD